MTYMEKKAFVRQMITNLRDDMLRTLPKVPKEWDGFELRQLMIDKAHNFSARMDGRRTRNYIATVRERNLDR